MWACLPLPIASNGFIETDSSVIFTPVLGMKSTEVKYVVNQFVKTISSLDKNVALLKIVLSLYRLVGKLIFPQLMDSCSCSVSKWFDNYCDGMISQKKT